jgi:hypothetical protein
MTLFYLRTICLVLWSAAVIALIPGTWRFVRGVYNAGDQWRTVSFFTALLFIGGLSRWLFIPDSDGLFVALYALTAALAVFVLTLAVQERSK